MFVKSLFAAQIALGTLIKTRDTSVSIRGNQADTSTLEIIALDSVYHVIQTCQHHPQLRAVYSDHTQVKRPVFTDLFFP